MNIMLVRGLQFFAFDRLLPRSVAVLWKAQLILLPVTVPGRLATPLSRVWFAGRCAFHEQCVTHRLEVPYSTESTFSLELIMGKSKPSLCSQSPCSFWPANIVALAIRNLIFAFSCNGPRCFTKNWVIGVEKSQFSARYEKLGHTGLSATPEGVLHTLELAKGEP